MVKAATFPWSWYAEPEVFRREDELIFRRAWQYVGHTGDLGEGGSYFTRRVGQVPVVVTRDRAGTIRGFVNVCRHRGFPVAAGAGRRETLQCAYHAWTYALDGQLRAAPRSDVEPDFDRQELPLRPVAVDTWGPFVFANPDPDAAPLAETLRELPALVAAAGIDVETLEFRLRTEFAVDANWKIVSENFLECYHCAVAHPGFNEMVDTSLDGYRLEPGETFSSQFGPLRDDGTAPYDASGEVLRSQFHFVWPNTGINIFPGRANLSIGPMLPSAPARTERFLDYFFAPDVDQAWIDELLAFDDRIGAEDRVLVEGVQLGVSSGVIDAGLLMERSEILVADFQRRVASALADT